jgi:hypothetical protein
MDKTVITYALYLGIALPLTIWVARSLFRNGRMFLVECFHGDEGLADGVNHLLVVGFYLINFGFVALYLKMTEEVVAVRGVFEALSGKIGVVLLVLGAMHFFNLFVFTRMRRRTVLNQAPPPIPPQGYAVPKV